MPFQRGTKRPQRGTDGLTDRHRAFIREYLIDLNAGAAAIRAGYSNKNPRDTGAKLLAHPAIAPAVKKAMDERAKRTEITADRVLQELAKIGFSDLRDVATWDENGVQFKSSDKIEDDHAKTIKTVKSKRRISVDKEGTQTETVELEITREDKVAALAHIGKHLGMFIDRREVKEVDEFSSLTDADLEREIKAEAATRGKATETSAED